MRYTAFAQIAILMTVLVNPIPLGSSQAGDTLKDRARARGGKTSSDLHLDLPLVPVG